MRVRLRARRGSALILVLVMTLAVAALAVAAIFMSSSAGLLSRFYDREREYRLAAESALEIVRSRLVSDTSLAIPDTGMMQVAAGLQIATAGGGVASNVSVNVYAAVTGDTTGRWLPHVTLIAAAYDAGGTRHVRRMDLRRESFSRYQLFVDSFPSGVTFGPGHVAGRVHTNTTWRSGTTAATAGVYRDTISAVDGFSGTATYHSDSVSGVPRVHYPRDSTYAWMTALATAANLAFAPVSGSGAGWVRGSRLEFVTVDANANGVIDAAEGFVRVFDLAAGVDTSRLRVSIDPSTWYVLYLAKPWTDPVVQNQCGAFYLRGGRWHFFPVSTHRATWARNVIQATGAGNFPAVTNPTMSTMDDYSFTAASTVLSQSTARCFPAGSPYLLTTERMTNSAGVVTGTAADTVPFGVVVPPGGWPASAPNGYGGADTTFTPRARTCSFSTGGVTGRCDSGTHATLGEWRLFGGTAISGVPTSVRQTAELPYLWPLTAPVNPAARGVLRATSGPLFVGGVLRGAVTLVVDGHAVVIESVEQVQPPSDPTTEACADQLGIVATEDVVVADNALVRARRIGNTLFSSLTAHYGPSRDITIHAQLMSLTGTVGVENPGSPSPTGGSALACPQDGATNSAGGCYNLSGGAIMQRYTPLYSGNNTGFRYAGTPDRCQSTNRRPPFFPLTNRYTLTRTLEIEASKANNPTKIRSILMQLKGKTL